MGVIDYIIVLLIKNPKSKIANRALARTSLKNAEWELDPLNEEGSVWKAADDYFLAKYFAKQGGDSELIRYVNEIAKERTFQGYNPLNSKDLAIREIAWVEGKKEKILGLLSLIEEEYGRENYAEAGNSIIKAIHIAEEIRDPKLAETIRQIPRKLGK